MRSGASWISCSSTSWRGEFVAGGPAARRPAFSSNCQIQSQSSAFLIRREGVGCGWAGHAVNPSMGARSAHGCASRSCPAAPDASGHVPANAVGLIPRLSAVGRCQPWLALLLILLCASSFDLDFLLSFRGLRKLSGGVRVAQAGPLAPWMAPSSPHGWVHGVSCLGHPYPSSQNQQRRRTPALLRVVPTAVGILARPQLDGGQQCRRRRDAAQRQRHRTADTQRLEVGAE